jgi:protocatechuate 3,4-dioxygenase beta subunit
MLVVAVEELMVTVLLQALLVLAEQVEEAEDMQEPLDLQDQQQEVVILVVVVVMDQQMCQVVMEVLVKLF